MTVGVWTSASSEMPLQTRWNRLLQSLGASSLLEQEYDLILTHYCESHRFYHTLTHLQDCLAKFDRHAHTCPHPAFVEVALWYHDVIYDPQAANNEQASAALCAAHLALAGIDAMVIKTIQTLILATQHTATVTDADAALLVDIDLSILGEDEDTFREYDRQIRQEYAFVPEAIYRTKRRHILQSFLGRDRIYQTAFFYQTYEAQAQRNLSRAIDALA